VRDEPHLLAAARYVELNPVRAARNNPDEIIKYTVTGTLKKTVTILPRKPHY